ncbi:MAG: hypothetical protein KDJ48_04120 [Nitratireductor sp.]|nr:hypothetical protein [Nitratireductor sp.]MCB1458445.1 hypothetical protein [Nitratireductor sp.]
MSNCFREASPDFPGHDQPGTRCGPPLKMQEGSVPIGRTVPSGADIPGCGIAERMILRLVAHATGCAAEKLTSSDRGTGAQARSRQIAMYLIHTSLSVPYGEVATIFCRDRTTVAHACRTIEDMRDTPAFDDLVCGLEETIELMASMAGFATAGGARP